jgi:hypothetical protein
MLRYNFLYLVREAEEVLCPLTCRCNRPRSRPTTGKGDPPCQLADCAWDTLPGQVAQGKLNRKSVLARTIVLGNPVSALGCPSHDVVLVHSVITKILCSDRIVFATKRSEFRGITGRQRLD